MTQSEELSEMEELRRMEERTTRTGEREVEILDWERVQSTEGADKVVIEFLTPQMEVEQVQVDWPETKSPNYKFVRIVNGFGYTLEEAHRIKGKELMATVDDEGNWRLKSPSHDVPAHVQQRADQIRDAYESLHSAVFSGNISFKLPLTEDVTVDASKPVRRIGVMVSVLTSALLYGAMVPVRVGKWVGGKVRTAALVFHVLFPYRKVRKGIEGFAAMITGVGLGTAIVLLILLSLYSSMQGRDEVFALSEKWFVRFFGIGAIIKFPAIAVYILLFT